MYLLVGLKPTHCVADFLRELKQASSIWITETIRLPNFRWQEGYGAFTVSASAKSEFQDYMARHEEHHRQRTFRGEYLLMLQKSGIEFDERYVD